MALLCNLKVGETSVVDTEGNYSVVQDGSAFRSYPVPISNKNNYVLMNLNGQAHDPHVCTCLLSGDSTNYTTWTIAFLGRINRSLGGGSIFFGNNYKIETVYDSGTDSVLIELGDNVGERKPAPPLGEWTWIVFRCNGSNVELYYNGVSQGVIAETPTLRLNGSRVGSTAQNVAYGLLEWAEFYFWDSYEDPATIGYEIRSPKDIAHNINVELLPEDAPIDKSYMTINADNTITCTYENTVEGGGVCWAAFRRLYDSPSEIYAKWEFMIDAGLTTRTNQADTYQHVGLWETTQGRDGADQQFLLISDWDTGTDEPSTLRIVFDGVSTDISTLGVPEKGVWNELEVKFTSTGTRVSLNGVYRDYHAVTDISLIQSMMVGTNQGIHPYLNPNIHYRNMSWYRRPYKQITGIPGVAIGNGS